MEQYEKVQRINDELCRIVQEKFNIVEFEDTRTAFTPLYDLTYCLNYERGEVAFPSCPNLNIKIKHFLENEYGLKYDDTWRFGKTRGWSYTTYWRIFNLIDIDGIYIKLFGELSLNKVNIQKSLDKVIKNANSNGFEIKSNLYVA